MASFTNLILETPNDQWQQRVQALRKLVDSIPEGSRYSGGGAAWYNTPPLLRHLAIAIGDLLKDPRSTVVKRTCESLTRLFLKCQSDGRYLFKDLMPVILSVHAQTVQVIRNAVQEMVVDSIPEVPCKMVMPLWMERLKVDKSRTVRDACALYLGQALRNWTAEGYLTDEIWVQVGGTLMRSLRDPSPNVRSHAKSALEYMQRAQPGCWQRLVEDEDSPAAKDPKLLRWLRTLGQEGGEAEELSVASKFSYNSDARYARQPRASPSSRRGIGGMDDLTDYSIDESLSIPMSIQVSTSAAAAAAAASKSHSSRHQQQPRTAPVPVRVSAPFQQIIESPPPHYPSSSAAKPTPLTPAGGAAMGTPPRHPSSLPSSAEKHRSPSTFLQTIEDQEPSDHEVESASSFPPDLHQHSGGFHPQRQAALQPSPASSTATATHPSPNGDIAAASSMISDPVPYGNSTLTGSEDGPFIASMQELKKHAAQRRSRNSILMKQRFRMSVSSSSHPAEGSAATSGGPLTSGLSTKRSEEENNIPNASSSSGGGGGLFASSSQFQQPKSSSSFLLPSSSASLVSTAPEHMVIAIRLLRAHKAHVDQIMETLKIEMDTLRDFDRLLEEPGRPSEEEVLDYFESVGLCLDQRLQAGQQLQREMDRISRGEPPQE